MAIEFSSYIEIRISSWIFVLEGKLTELDQRAGGGVVVDKLKLIMNLVCWKF